MSLAVSLKVRNISSFNWHNICPSDSRIINLLLMKTNIRLLVFIAVFFSAIANLSAQTKKVEKYGDVYSLSEKISGVYIPKDMEDAMRELDGILSDEEKSRLKEVGSGIELHFGLGMWLRNNWGLWVNSRLVAALEKAGRTFFDADGVSLHICCAYLDHLNGKKYVARKGEDADSYSDRNNDFVVNENNWDYIGKNRQKFIEKGIVEGKKVKFGYKYGFSSGMEEQTVKELKELREPEGVITDVNYYNRHYKVKLVKSYSPHGIVIFDGNVKRGEDGKYNLNKNYAHSFTSDPSVFFMQYGDEVWFDINNGMWTIVE